MSAAISGAVYITCWISYIHLSMYIVYKSSQKLRNSVCIQTALSTAVCVYMWVPGDQIYGQICEKGVDYGYTTQTI